MPVSGQDSAQAPAVHGPGGYATPLWAPSHAGARGHPLGYPLSYQAPIREGQTLGWDSGRAYDLGSRGRRGLGHTGPGAREGLLRAGARSLGTWVPAQRAPTLAQRPRPWGCPEAGGRGCDCRPRALSGQKAPFPLEKHKERQGHGRMTGRPTTKAAPTKQTCLLP